MKFIAAFICFFVALSPSLHAEELTDNDKANIERLIMGYADAIDHDNYYVIVARIPPEIRAKIAEYSLMDKTAINGVIAKELEFQNKMLQISDMKPDFKTIQYGNFLPNVPYFLVPVSYNIVDASGQHIKINTDLFGIFLERAWYMVRADDDVVIHFWRELYPEMKNINFRETKFSIIKNN